VPLAATSLLPPPPAIEELPVTAKTPPDVPETITTLVPDRVGGVEPVATTSAPVPGIVALTEADPLKTYSVVVELPDVVGGVIVVTEPEVGKTWVVSPPAVFDIA
jgi:hypothetical protein